MSKLRLLPVLAIAVSALATSCAVTSPGKVNDEYRAVIEQRHDHYTMKDGDSFQVELYNLEDGFNQTSLVLPDGRSDLFYMNDFKFAGRTVDEVEREVTERLKGQVRDEVTDVRVQVTPRPDTIYAVGEFYRPGSITLGTKMTLQEAVSRGGRTHDLRRLRLDASRTAVSQSLEARSVSHRHQRSFRGDFSPSGRPAHHGTNSHGDGRRVSP